MVLYPRIHEHVPLRRLLDLAGEQRRHLVPEDVQAAHGRLQLA